MSPKPSSSIPILTPTRSVPAISGRCRTSCARILDEERDALDRAAERIADQIAADRLVHIFGPGGHSNLAAQELFFRAGGLMHVAAILDEGTLLSNGALRSMAIERTPGYGRVVVADRRLGGDDLLILVNAYGINAALIDAALEARRRGVALIGVSSRRHAESIPADHPARHPSKQNLHDLVDVAIDTKVPVGDAVVSVPGLADPVAAISTFANAFALNCLVIRTVAALVDPRDRAAGLAQRQHAGRRRRQRPLHRPFPGPGPRPVSPTRVELTGRDPATGRPLAVEVAGRPDRRRSARVRPTSPPGWRRASSTSRSTASWATTSTRRT